jgi:xanthine dehydrogenase small subunit
MPHARPTTLRDALEVRASRPDWLVIAGGTDLMVVAPRKAPPAGVIDLFGLPELAGICRDGASIVIGAGTTYEALLGSDLVRERLPLLHAACREVGAVQIQARGTLGGNVATSSPVGDTLPCLLALDAEVELASVRGTRRVYYPKFLTGYRKVDLAPDELIASFRIPDPTPGTRQRWRKVGTRRAQAISKVMLAATARLEGEKISHARVALGAVADRPIRVEAAERLLVGRGPSAALADEVRAAVAGAIKPISDVRSTADYRRDTAAAMVARFVLELAGAP